MKFVYKCWFQLQQFKQNLCRTINTKSKKHYDEDFDEKNIKKIFFD